MLHGISLVFIVHGSKSVSVHLTPAGGRPSTPHTIRETLWQDSWELSPPMTLNTSLWWPQSTLLNADWYRQPQTCCIIDPIWTTSSPADMQLSSSHTTDPDLEKEMGQGQADRLIDLLFRTFFKNRRNYNLYG